MTFTLKIKNMRPMKGFLILLAAVFFALMPFNALHASAEGANSIVSIRTGEHRDFRRLVIELDGTVGFKVRPEKSGLLIEITGAQVKDKDMTLPKTDLFKVSGITELKNGDVSTTMVHVKYLKPARILDRGTRKSPFRIVLDVADAGKVKKAASVKAANPLNAKNNPRKSAITGKEAVKAVAKANLAEGIVGIEGLREKSNTDYPSVDVWFYNNWRWVYRKKTVELLKKHIDETGALKDLAFKTELGLPGSTRDELVSDAGILVASLKSGREPLKAKALEGIIAFYNGRKTPQELEPLLRSAQDASFVGLGYFLLGMHFDSIGFHPEAQGYYSRIISGENGGFLKGAALFQKARIYYVSGRFFKAKEVFEASRNSGYEVAGLWLANTLLARGEVDNARKIYDELAPKHKEHLDQITLLSMAEAEELKGRQGEARNIFYSLGSEFSKKDDYLAAYFTVKASDTFIDEGLKDQAIKGYLSIKDRDKKEPWAIASLSIADVLAKDTDAGRDKAFAVYESVASGSYTGSEHAYLKMISLSIDERRFEGAAASIKSFQKRFPTSALQQELYALEGRLSYSWIDELYKSGDYYGVVKVGYAHGANIPFGKKGDVFLEKGKAFTALNLSAEAAANLDSAIRIGRDPVAEEAMLMLGKVYIMQRDIDGAQRLFQAFKARFPKSVYMDEVRKLLLNAAFAKGDFAGVVGMDAPKEDPDVLIAKADAFMMLKRNNEASAMYKSAVKAIKDPQDRRLGRAYLKIADIDFDMKRFSDAVEGYRLALKHMGDEKGADKSWALYRIAQGYTILAGEAEPEQRDLAIKALGEADGELGGWATHIFSDAAKNL